MATTDLPGLIPTSVTVTFPKTVDGTWTGAAYVVTTTLASLALSEFSGALTNANSHIINASSVAAYIGAGTDPSNKTELDAMALQMAKDWYRWQLGKANVAFNRTVPFLPCGLIDAIEWTWQPPTTACPVALARTRVFRWPFNDMADRRLTSGAAGSIVNHYQSLYIQNLYTQNIISSLFQGTKFARVTVTSLGTGYSRTGNVITASANGTLGAQDGITLVATDRVLLRSGNSDAGLYEVTSVGSAGTKFVLTRTSDADDSTEMVSGTLVYVRHGTDGSGFKDTLWRLVTEPPITLNTTSLDFRLLSPQGVRLLAQEINGRAYTRFIAGTGITLSLADDAANDETELTIAASGSGITSLNGLTGASQTLVVGTGGVDFNIGSSGTVHTFNLPDASATARGVVTTGTQTLAGRKTFPGDVATDELFAISNSNRVNLDGSGVGCIQFTVDSGIAFSPTASLSLFTEGSSFGAGFSLLYTGLLLSASNLAGGGGNDPAYHVQGAGGTGIRSGQWGTDRAGNQISGGLVTSIPSAFSGGSIPISNGSTLVEDSGLQFDPTTNALTLGGGGYLISTAASAPSGIPTNSVAGPYIGT